MTGTLDSAPAALQVIVSRLPALQELLARDGEVQPTTLGPRIPLGFTRLRVVQFCVPLFFTNRACVDEALSASGLLGVVLDLFFKYEWNNFLHHRVESLVASLFDTGSLAVKHAAISK